MIMVFVEQPRLHWVCNVADVLHFSMFSLGWMCYNICFRFEDQHDSPMLESPEEEVQLIPFKYLRNKH